MIICQERNVMPDEKLATFLTVVNCGSLTKAAKRLRISQPAVTLQIHKLEQEYGEPLFYRQDRGVQLTPAGKIFNEYALRISQLYCQAKDYTARSILVLPSPSANMYYRKWSVVLKPNIRMWIYCLK